MEISGKTQLLGLIGSPVSHSISPAMHNEACRLLKLDYRYLAFDVKEEELEQAVNGLKAMHARGWNVTMPHKKTMASLCDELSPASKLSLSCNTVVNNNGKLYGTTTDGIGFLMALKEYGIDPAGKTMTLLGTGGAATAIMVQSALDGVKEINVFNRKGNSYSQAEEMINNLNKTTSCHVFLHDYSDLNVFKATLEKSQVLVNATPVGMAPNVEDSLIQDPSFLHKDLFVYDTIYNPRKTKLLKQAEEMGCKCGNGLYMLLYQGAASFKLWTNENMPVAEIKEKCFSD